MVENFSSITAGMMADPVERSRRKTAVNYYSSVSARMGPHQQDWLRLFMVPGMAHCGGGPGPNQVNWIAALERWRESGIAPDQLVASRVNDNRVDMTRPTLPLSTDRTVQWRG